MRYPEFHYVWRWQLESSRKALWRLVADTNRFNRDTGVPAVRPANGSAGAARNGRRMLRLTQMGVPIEWEEEPFEWVEPEVFGVVRRYTCGPVAEMRVLVELVARNPSGTDVRYQVWLRPRNLLGLVAIPFEIGWKRRRRFAAAVMEYDAEARRGETTQTHQTDVRLAPGGKARLGAIRDALLRDGARSDLVARLVHTIEHGDDLVVSRLRPYALADAWGAPRRDVLELCLWATRAGLLCFRWDLLCPNCRGAKQVGESLGEISSSVHCESCNIDFTVNFDRLVELTFRPNPAVRDVVVGEFCVGGPQVTPHIVAQQMIAPGGERTVLGPGTTGRYRIRTLTMPSGQLVSVTTDGPNEATLRASHTGWPSDEVTVGPRATLHICNTTDEEQLCILERMAWTDQAATAAEVTALQTFRDLFSTEALRPGEEISVGSLTVFFTDLRGSTRFYRDIGDAAAFGRVMDHFAVLREAVAAEDGAIVKTIGDAVMAVFPRPVGALRAAFRAQALLAQPPDGANPLHLKVGIHTGPCIAVTLNDRLDYFGSTVNIAARLEAQSSGTDVIISDAVRCDPEVADMLASGDRYVTTPLERTLKGFEGERFNLWSVAVAVALESHAAVAALE